MMNSEWNKLIGDLTYEERELLTYICNAGLRETRELLKRKEHVTGKARTQGAILAFETIEDYPFTTCLQLIEQWQKFDANCRKLRNQDEQIVHYWKMKGQQLQLSFILERILAYRVLTKQIDARISARAAIYVEQWMQQNRGISELRPS